MHPTLFRSLPPPFSKFCRPVGHACGCSWLAGRQASTSLVTLIAVAVCCAVMVAGMWVAGAIQNRLSAPIDLRSPNPDLPEVVTTRPAAR